jgi:hypothetical protein
MRAPPFLPFLSCRAGKSAYPESRIPFAAQGLPAYTPCGISPVKCRARICLQILAAKQEQAGFARRYANCFKRKLP